MNFSEKKIMLLQSDGKSLCNSLGFFIVEKMIIAAVDGDIGGDPGLTPHGIVYHHINLLTVSV